VTGSIRLVEEVEEQEKITDARNHKGPKIARIIRASGIANLVERGGEFNCSNTTGNQALWDVFHENWIR
jgi:hypothetical protein